MTSPDPHEVVARALRRLRVVPVLFAVLMAALANRLWTLDQQVDDPTAFYPGLWPWLALAAAVACVAYAVTFESRALLAVSGALCVVVPAARAVAVLLAIVENAAALTSAQLHIAGLIYTGFAACAAWVWVYDLRPATTYEAEVDHRHRGS